ncbi:hypothetical protein [Nonomuraea dietziae]|uniref:hypothetical protein n=1 Tax=Nonomuraea dietziae TaxID=65515 RepID=UPI0031CFB5B8
MESSGEIGPTSYAEAIALRQRAQARTALALIIGTPTCDVAIAPDDELLDKNLTTLGDDQGARGWARACDGGHRQPDAKLADET